jgi:hypothetical protein
VTAAEKGKGLLARSCYACCAVKNLHLKSDIVSVIQDLPEDATVEDAMERLYFLAKVERGLEQSEGETISHEEIKARFLNGSILTPLA